MQNGFDKTKGLYAVDMTLTTVLNNVPCKY